MAKKPDVFYMEPDDRIMSIIVYIALAALCLSPMPTFVRILKKKSTEEFHPYPYMAALTNSFVWFVYSIPFKPIQIPIPFRFSSLYLCNVTCLYFLYFYCAIFWRYTTAKNKAMLVSNFGIAFLLFCTLCYMGASWSDTPCDRVQLTTMRQARFAGPIGVVSGIIMYGSPLSMMKRIYVTNSVEYLPYWPCLAYILYGLVWFFYACLPPGFDPYIAITNGVGAILGLLQLAVHYKFPVRFEEDPRDPERPYPREKVETYQEYNKIRVVLPAVNIVRKRTIKSVGTLR